MDDLDTSLTSSCSTSTIGFTSEHDTSADTIDLNMSDSSASITPQVQFQPQSTAATAAAAPAAAGHPHSTHQPLTFDKTKPQSTHRSCHPLSGSLFANHSSFSPRPPPHPAKLPANSAKLAPTPAPVPMPVPTIHIIQGGEYRSLDDDDDDDEDDVHAEGVGPKSTFPPLDSTYASLSSTVIRLNVGGDIFQTTAQTLFGFEHDSYFCSRFSGRYVEHPSPFDGAYFIDRDGTHFRHLLNWLRDQRLAVNDEDTLQQILREAEYYQLNHLVGEVLNRLAALERASRCTCTRSKTHTTNNTTPAVPVIPMTPNTNTNASKKSFTLPPPPANTFMQNMLRGRNTSVHHHRNLLNAWGHGGMAGAGPTLIGTTNILQVAPLMADSHAHPSSMMPHTVHPFVPPPHTDPPPYSSLSFSPSRRRHEASCPATPNRRVPDKDGFGGFIDTPQRHQRRHEWDDSDDDGGDWDGDDLDYSYDVDVSMNSVSPSVVIGASTSCPTSGTNPAPFVFSLAEDF